MIRMCFVLLAVCASACQAQTAPAPPSGPVAPQVAADPYGFLTWLNATRASYGLRPVAYDAVLTQWAQANNSQQTQRGLGHWVMGPARRQNAGMGEYVTVCNMWMASGGHRAALLDPTITRIGIAGLGVWWTFSAN